MPFSPRNLPSILRCSVAVMILASLGFMSLHGARADEDQIESYRAKPRTFKSTPDAYPYSDREFIDNIDRKAQPPYRSLLEDIKPENIVKEGEELGMPINLRLGAIKEAALSYGARGGLAWRTFYIRQEMEGRQAYMDKVFDFRALLIAAPSGLIIEPPVISEQDDALIIHGTGAQAAVADRVFEINKNAKIVSAPRHWRNYLEREWGDVTPPPDILRPRNDEERKAWIENIRNGWDKGVHQADEIFQDDLNQLTADYRGMVRYRMLLAQNMVSPPYAVQTDRGVTGGGNSMRIGDRQVEITGMPELNPGARNWNPANR